MGMDMNEINATLSALFVNQYNRTKENGLPRVNFGGVARYVMIQVYNEFVKDKILMPIEELSFDDKMSLVDECRATGEFFTNETLIEQSKMLHVIRTINSNT